MTSMACFLVSSAALFSLALTPSAGAAPPSKAKPDAAIAVSAGNAPANLIDINSASITELRALPGIGTANARKIVSGRPYASVDDLKTRGILSNGTYDRIHGRISTKRNTGVATREQADTSVPGTSTH